MAKKEYKFSPKKKQKRDGVFDNFDSELSHDPIKQEEIDYEEWSEFMSYYRYYLDEFACDILGLKLYPFQRVILRAMGRYQNSMFIACRGKLFLAPLYSNI